MDTLLEALGCVWRFLLLLMPAMPGGALLGLVIGPFRISGVDFGKWYRDPGEIFEGRDRSWMGVMRTAFLFGAKMFWILLGLAAAAWLGWLAWRWTAGGEWLVLAPAMDLLRRCGPPVLGFAAGLVAAQAAVEAAWRLGKRTAVATKPRLLAKVLVAKDRREQLVKRRTTAWAPAQPLAVSPGAGGRRRLIICCDGTWNRPVDGRDTNVVRLARAIQPVAVDADGTTVTQIVRYHLGVGTGNILDRLVGGGAGVGLSASVKTCYGFLVDNYREGDEILLFGFSRGAYVARSIAGLIGRVGILRKDEMHRFEEAWNYYRLENKTAGDLARLNELAPHRCKNVPVACVGVWDTVGALGVPGSRFCSSTYAFHETGLGVHVRHAFQALALDECRGNFQPAVWVRGADVEGQVLEQVWFPGVHSNIGGGYEGHGLADASFLWMLGCLAEHKLLELDTAVVRAALEQYQAEDYARGRVRDSRGLFWKLAFSAVPRPVCLTDPSERIHESALVRVCDTYEAGTARHAWLRGLDRVAVPRPFETQFAFTGAGMPHETVFPSPEGWCEWLTGKIIGSQ